MDVFKNLGEDKAEEMFNELVASGHTKDEAFTEIYSIECNMDGEE